MATSIVQLFRTALSQLVIDHLCCQGAQVRRAASPDCTIIHVHTPCVKVVGLIWDSTSSTPLPTPADRTP